MRKTLILLSAVYCSVLPLAQNAAPSSAPNVREEAKVRVQGIEETWRLQWNGPTRPYCPANDDVAITCPCMGFAYGESGSLSLVRLSKGSEVERINLDSHFSDTSGTAVLQRHAIDFKHDSPESNEFAALVEKRPLVKTMNFYDYDHDGQKTEFFLQTEVLPCGKSSGVVIGVSKIDAKLHAFTSVDDPQHPLHLQQREWEALRNAKTAPVIVIDWRCGDHGAEEQTELSLRWSANGISGVRRNYACTSQLKRGRLLETKPL